ncbi:MAG: carboxypeptidase regulatory-like domain-containing protein [Planctomycetia bacterium]|jgi:hypothetical protein|nr:carboxypeptidase regulatory-like domain-containing protein [Planctomycetia bacterium]
MVWRFVLESGIVTGRLLVSTGCLVIAVVGTGCGGRPAGFPETAAVTGVITFDEMPLEGATVSFLPDEGRSSVGTTDSAGRYRLKFTGTVSGAVLGMHHVSVSKQAPDPDFKITKEEQEMLENGDFLIPTVDVVPGRYQGRASELTAEVKSGRNSFDFALTSD